MGSFGRAVWENCQASITDVWSVLHIMSRSLEWNKVSDVYKCVSRSKWSLSGCAVIFLAESSVKVCKKIKPFSYSLFVSFVHRTAKKLKEWCFSQLTAFLRYDLLKIWDLRDPAAWLAELRCVGGKQSARAVYWNSPILLTICLISRSCG